MARGSSRLTKPWQTPNTWKCQHGRQTSGANVRRQEGNNPDRQLRSLNIAKWETKWEGKNSQEVGLEAAILQRKRNSSLIESSCAEDVTGLSDIPKLRMRSNTRGRGAFCKPAKVHRKVCWRYQKCEC
jgi:hypothetical protein